MRAYVTRELFPFTAGGIGRVIGNILLTSTPGELAETAIIYLGPDLTESQFNAVYPNVIFRNANAETYAEFDTSEGHYPPASSYTDSILHFESVAAMQQLIELEREGHALTYVEFPDWGAAAFASTQEKKLGKAFKNAVLAVRLHSTDSVLATVEARNVDIHGLAVYDLERKALADCDLIVAQLQTVSDRMRDFYGFEGADWDVRMVVDAPPVVLDYMKPAETSTVISAKTPIVFSSKIQHVKRPDIFIQGAVEFLRRNEDYEGQIKFLAHAFDHTYLDRIKAFVPEEFEDRVEFLGGVKGEARERLIGDSVCVFPSAWESFCLATYEASLAGALCLVNSRNVAFEDGTPWIDGVNCLKFDGTSSALAETLDEVFTKQLGKSFAAVTLAPSARPYDRQLTSQDSLNSQDDLTLEYLMLARDCGTQLLEALDRLNEVTAAPLKVAILDNGSHGTLDKRVLERVSRLEGVRVIRETNPISWAELIAKGVDSSEADLVAILEPCIEIDPAFVERAVHALSSHQEYSFVTSSYALDDQHSVCDDSVKQFSQTFVYIGEARCTGLHSNRFSGHFFVMRTNVLRELPMRSGLPFGVQWELFMRVIGSGYRGVVDARIGAVERSGSVMSRPIEITSTPDLGMNELIRDKFLNFGMLKLPAYVMSPKSTVSVIQGQDGGALLNGDVQEKMRRLAELDESETVQLTLKTARILNTKFPWLLRVGRRVIGPFVRR